MSSAGEGNRRRFRTDVRLADGGVCIAHTVEREREEIERRKLKYGEFNEAVEGYAS